MEISVNTGVLGPSRPRQRPNDHIAIPHLRDLLRVQLATIENDLEAAVELEPLGKLKTVEDATTKALIRTRDGRPVAVVVVSRPIAPDLMARGVLLAEQVREVVGPRLGEVVIKSLNCGYVDGRSYVILPWCRTPAERGVGRAWACLRLRRPVLDWLHAATTVAAAVEREPDDPRETFAAVLENVAGLAFLDDDDKAAARRALARIESCAWRPRHTVDHNDLWFGNVMLPERPFATPGPRHPFVLIDWAGANACGYGVYDLVRMARSFKLSTGLLGRELRRHAEVLGCELADCEGHLLAALGRLHRHLECFPEAQYIRTFRQCRETLAGAMGAA